MCELARETTRQMLESYDKELAENCDKNICVIELVEEAWVVGLWD